MEKYIDIQYITNLINLGYNSSSKIKCFTSTKTKICLLLQDNDLVIYEPSTQKLTSHHFATKIANIKSNRDRVYLVCDTQLILINTETFEEIFSYNISEQFFLVSFFEKQNMEMVYTNAKNEVKYYSKNLINEVSFKNLYKENSEITELIYQNGYLLWVADNTVKVFDLNKRKMLLKKAFEKNTQNKKFSIIDCLIYNSILCINVHNKDIYIYRLSSEDFKYTCEIARIENKLQDATHYYIGMWINSSLTKLSLLTYNENHVDLDIMKIDTYSTNNNLKGQVYFRNKFNYVMQNDNNDIINFTFSNANGNVYLYSNNEIYYVTLTDKSTKLFSELSMNDYKFTEDDIILIFETFNSFDLNKQNYILMKIIRQENKDEEHIGLFLKIKFTTLFNTVFSQVNNQTKILFNNFLFLLIKKGKFETVYKIIKTKINDFITTSTKERCIDILLKKKMYQSLYKFINDVNEIELTQKVERIFINVLTNIDDENKSKVKFIYGHLNIKNKNFNKALSLFVSIKEENEIFKILSNGNCEFIFNYDEIFHILNESKLLTILDFIYMKKGSLLNIFFERLFALCSPEKISNFSFYLISYDKFRLIKTQKIANDIFKVLLTTPPKIPTVNLVMTYSDTISKFLKMSPNLDYNKLIDDNIEILQQKEYYNVYITLLTYIKNYKKIIDLFIEEVKKPEECIKFIENNIVEDKEEIYSYLRMKIHDTSSLSNAKKFYLISQFDDLNISDKKSLALLEGIGNNKEDIQYLLMTIEQMKIKKDILNVTKEIAKEHLGCLCEVKKKYTILGKGLDQYNNIKCSCESCDNDQSFQKDEEVICFKMCSHLFHTECYNKMKIYFKENELQKNACPICSLYY